MKKVICLLLALLLSAALFVGCDLQNRRPSSDFIPVTEPTESTAPPETVTEEPTVESTAAVMQVVVRDAGTPIEGAYTDRYGNNYKYKYHVPYIDAEAEYAQGCNKEIDQVFGMEVKKQQNAMLDGSTLTIASVDYMTRLRGNILTLYVTMKDFEGEQTRRVYMLNRNTGKEIPGEELLAFLGVDGDTFLALAEQTVEAAFEETYGESRWTDQLAYNSAHDRTMRAENISLEMPMYIDESDRLTILATIYDLAGAAHLEPLVVELEQPAEES